MFISRSIVIIEVILRKVLKSYIYCDYVKVAIWDFFQSDINACQLSPDMTQLGLFAIPDGSEMQKQ